MKKFMTKSPHFQSARPVNGRTKIEKANKQSVESTSFVRLANNVAELHDQAENEEFHRAAILKFEEEGGQIPKERYETVAS